VGRWDLVDEELGRIAARQHGLVTREQALGAGASLDLVEHRLRSGRWERCGPTVYRLLGCRVTWQQRALAACLDAGPGSFVSHRAAAVLWGISGFRPGRIEVTVPANRNSRSSLALVHRSMEVPRSDRTIRDGIPVSRPSRMIIDLAATTGKGALEEAVDDVLCRRLVSPGELNRRAQEMGRRRGSATLRSILSPWIPPAEADPSVRDNTGLPANVAEMRIARMLIAHRLPRPVHQHEIRDSRGRFVARVDLAYPEARIAIEVDGFRWHAGRGPFRSDRVRGNRIEGEGWRLLRATTEDTHSGDDLCRSVARLLSAAAAA
jgi:very-short-patch-repair endonuclease